MPEARRLLTRNDYRMAALALLLYAAGRAPFLGQWDSFDYLKQTVTHRLSDLAFGRPVFIGYNIALWESARWLFRLRPTQVESVMMFAVVALGGAGVLLFARLARQMLPAEAARMAVIGFALSPLYAIYAGYIMTEVPMLAALLGCASLLWPRRRQGTARREVVAGVLFGLAIGIREQALTLAPGFAWIMWVRRDPHDRLLSLARFSGCAAAVGLFPVLGLYLHDPAAFMERTRVWLRAIPMGQTHFDRNVQASLLFTFGMAPALWIGLVAAAWSRLARRAQVRAAECPTDERPVSPGGAFAGAVLCLVLPLVVLWRDADVQLHPRYSLIVLPAASIVCASAFHSCWKTRRAALAWGILQVTVFGVAQLAILPFRQIQTERMNFAHSIRDAVPGEGLIAAGSYSPILDYYRAVGERPQWEILWSGWGWKAEAAARIVHSAWLRGQPVYVCDGPLAWAYFEDERLDLFYIFRNQKCGRVAPGITRVSRLESETGR